MFSFLEFLRDACKRIIQDRFLHPVQFTDQNTFMNDYVMFAQLNLLGISAFTKLGTTVRLNVHEQN